MDQQPNNFSVPTEQQVSAEYQVGPLPPAPIPIGMDYKPPELPVKKKHRFLKPLLVCLLCELLIGAGAFLYFWRDGMAIDQQNADAETIQELEQQVTDLEAQIMQYESGSTVDQQTDSSVITDEEFLQNID